MELESNGPHKHINHILMRLFICGTTGRSFGNCKIRSSFLGDLDQLFDFCVQIPSTIHPILGLVIISEVRSKLGRGSLAWHQNHGDRGLYFTITLMIEFMNNRNAVMN
ncbi:unnamed protein product [Citrullus colocynthis]|uniref:Uncharacterized protein n=1 Tax=Citrullus colocynthis TaxID=252529 RepID=A0ABP0Y7T2_9ROSI